MPQWSKAIPPYSIGTLAMFWVFQRSWPFTFGLWFLSAPSCQKPHDFNPSSNHHLAETFASIAIFRETSNQGIHQGSNAP